MIRVGDKITSLLRAEVKGKEERVVQHGVVCDLETLAGRKGFRWHPVLGDGGAQTQFAYPDYLDQENFEWCHGWVNGEAADALLAASALG